MNDCTFRVPDQRGWQPKGQLIDDHPGCSLDTHLHTDLDVAVLAGETIHACAYRWSCSGAACAAASPNLGRHCG